MKVEGREEIKTPLGDLQNLARAAHRRRRRSKESRQHLDLVHRRRAPPARADARPPFLGHHHLPPHRQRQANKYPPAEPEALWLLALQSLWLLVPQRDPSRNALLRQPPIARAVGAMVVRRYGQQERCGRHVPRGVGAMVVRRYGQQERCGRHVPRAVGAIVVSPALQRGVGETNNSSGVP
jgi:hypothetical protein